MLCAETKASRGKRLTTAAMNFHVHLETELPRLQRELETQTYQPGPYRTFTINDPKTRMISAAPFRDRVVHHALCNIVEPIFENVFIHDSYACRKGKGTHAAANRLTHFMQNRDFALKCDIYRYFPAIDHEILKTLIRKKIGCVKTLWLIDLLIDHSNPQEPLTQYFPGDDLFTPHTRRRGLPIGNQTSQFFANIYLNPLDHFIKEKLGGSAYIRYVDDFVILEDSKDRLWDMRKQIADFLGNELRLNLHPRKQSVDVVTSGIDFVGYRIFPRHRLLRRSSGVRFARTLRRLQRTYGGSSIGIETLRPRIMAWLGHACHADTQGLRTSLFEKAVFRRAETQTTRPAGRFLEQQQY